MTEWIKFLAFIALAFGVVAVMSAFVSAAFIAAAGFALWLFDGNAAALVITIASLMILVLLAHLGKR